MPTGQAPFTDRSQFVMALSSLSRLLLHALFLYFSLPLHPEGSSSEMEGMRLSPSGPSLVTVEVIPCAEAVAVTMIALTPVASPPAAIWVVGSVPVRPVSATCPDKSKDKYVNHDYVPATFATSENQNGPKERSIQSQRLL